MAVYTTLSKADIQSFLGQYDVGELVSFKGIAEGVENTNYLLVTKTRDGQKRYILTVYEQRVNPSDLPFFLGLTEWLADRGINCPRPVRSRAGVAVQELKGKSAALIHFLEGRGNPHITPRHLELTGELAARMHLAAEGFPQTRRNAMGLEAWQTLFTGFRNSADGISPGLEKEIESELAHAKKHWPQGLPKGIIHADIFPDNVFFIDGNTDQPELSGVIDFYFACNDYWAYELAICLNAWCFDTGHQYVPARGQALFKAYNKLRPLTDAEKKAFPTLARASALRFLMTRIHDWINRPAGALVNPKDPKEYLAKLHFHQQAKSLADYGI